MPIINEAEAIHNARPHHFLYTQDPSHGPLWYTDKLGEGPVFMTCYSFVATLILRVHIRSFGVFEDGVQHDLSNCGIARYFDKYGPRSFVGALQQHLVRKPQSGIPLCTGRLLNGWTNYLVRGDILLFAGPPHKNKEAGPSEVWHAACVETPNNHDGSKTVVRDMGAPRLCLCKCELNIADSASV